MSPEASRVKDIRKHKAPVHPTVIVNLYFYQGTCSNICTNTLNLFSARNISWHKNLISHSVIPLDLPVIYF